MPSEVVPIFLLFTCCSSLSTVPRLSQQGFTLNSAHISFNLFFAKLPLYLQFRFLIGDVGGEGAQLVERRRFLVGETCIVCFRFSSPDSLDGTVLLFE